MRTFFIIALLACMHADAQIPFIYTRDVLSAPAPASPVFSGGTGVFSFTLDTSMITSAGVFKQDSILVKTLWNGVRYAAGTYTRYWDGTDDNGLPIAKPDTSYTIKVVRNNVRTTWQGTIGNTSDNMTGNSKHRGYYVCMRGLAFGSTYGYFTTGYSEAANAHGKFAIAAPNTKINYAPSGVGNDTEASHDYVACDGTYVYWACFDGYQANNTFVYATKVSDDTEVSFTKGRYYKVQNAKAYNKVIGYKNAGNSKITGLAARSTSSFLFIARAAINELLVLNKLTGDTAQTLTYTNARALSLDGSGNLWMATGINTVAKYSVNVDGSLNAASVTLSGILEPLATQVSADGTLVSVADGSTSQQVKFFNNTTGASTATLGTAGGYSTDPAVNNSKFYFTDVNGLGSGGPARIPFITYQPDGTFWVNDPGNYRVQHYNASRVYVDRIMSLGSSYSVWADKNNINKLFFDWLEFEIDYATQTLTGLDGWNLKNNWGATTSSTIYDRAPKYITTLSNGRTYGLQRKGVNSIEVVEFAPSGGLRFTNKILPGVTKVLCSDGSYIDYVLTASNTIATVYRYPLASFDGSNNPVWSTTPEILWTGATGGAIGNSINTPNSQTFNATTNKVVSFNHKAWSVNPTATTPAVYSRGPHLSIMSRGSNNRYLVQTEKSTHRAYAGAYPAPGWFDEGNQVNDFAGGNVNFVDSLILTSYHGEFWKAAQTNRYNLYYLNGLALGQFGTDRPSIGGYGNYAAAEMAGNALTPVLVKDGSGNLYLYHGDESDHAGVHRWKIDRLNTIAVQTIPLSYPIAYTRPSVSYTDLMDGLSFNASLVNNTAGWTRSPATDVVLNANTNHFIISTNTLKYDPATTPDLFIKFAQPTAGTDSLSRDLGTNNVTNDWSITGSITLGGQLNGYQNNFYIDVLDDAYKVITTNYTNLTTGKLYGNGTIITNVSTSTKDFSVSFVAPSSIYFTYNGVTTAALAKSDAAANPNKPKKIRIRAVSGSAVQNYRVTLGIQDFKFYKDVL